MSIGAKKFFEHFFPSQQNARICGFYFVTQRNNLLDPAVLSVTRKSPR